MSQLIKCYKCDESIELISEKPAAFCPFCGVKLNEKIDSETTEVVNSDNVNTTMLNVNDNTVNNTINSQNLTLSNTQQQDLQTKAPQQKPTLYISYTTANYNVTMSVRILNAGYDNLYYNNQAFSYCLNPGIYFLQFRIGNRTYNRNINIMPGGFPIQIYCSWNGRANIVIR